MIPMAGVPCQRPRAAFINGRAQIYEPKKTKDFEKKIAEHYREATGGYRFPDDAPLIVSMAFGFKPPESASKKRKEEMIWGKVPYIKRPDLDNLAKAVLDGLNEVAFKDDSQIIALNVSKEYAREDRIWVFIRECQ